jgi:hypothetical protein
MKIVAEYRHYADVCRKLSLHASDPMAKRQLMEMATVWTLLAGEREEDQNATRVSPQQFGPRNARGL